MLWTALFGGGLLIGLHGLADVRADRAAHAGKNGINEMLLMTRRRRLRVACVGLLIAFLLGFESLLPITFEGEGLIAVVGLFGQGICFVVFVILEQTDRSMLRRMM